MIDGSLCGAQHRNAPLVWWPSDVIEGLETRLKGFAIELRLGRRVCKPDALLRLHFMGG